MEKGKYDPAFIEKVNDQEFDPKKILTIEDFKEITEEGWFIDESDEAEPILSETDKKAIKDFEEGK